MLSLAIFAPAAENFRLNVEVELYWNHAPRTCNSPKGKEARRRVEA